MQEAGGCRSRGAAGLAVFLSLANRSQHCMRWGGGYRGGRAGIIAGDIIITAGLDVEG